MVETESDLRTKEADCISMERTYTARIFELIEVLATLIKHSLPSLSTFVESCSAMNLQASLHASLRSWPSAFLEIVT